MLAPCFRALFSCVQLLQQNLEANFYSGRFNWDEVSPNDAAALLKKFIRDLPDPLLTTEYLNTFSAVRGQWMPRSKSSTFFLFILFIRGLR